MNVGLTVKKCSLPIQTMEYQEENAVDIHIRWFTSG